MSSHHTTPPALPLRILFVCGKNLRRSPTAEALYRNDPRVQVRSAGVSEKSRRRIRHTDIAWANLILVMERKHAARIREAFPDVDADADMGGDPEAASDSSASSLTIPPQIFSLEIPDDYDYMDAELVDLLKQGVEFHLLSYRSLE